MKRSQSWRIYAHRQPMSFSMFSRILPTVVAIHGNGYDSQHYNFFAIIFVGYKVISERAVQFRKWATGVYATSIDYDVTAEISQAGKYCT